tara:strand:- start:260 stop:493 length:234 start_codon:yes stop_codon:yes gene_type:complete
VAKNLKDERGDSAIERLMNQPLEVMEKVLSNASQKNVPIEVDGVVYYIPKAVSDLINHLYIQISKEDPAHSDETNEA